MYSAPLSTSNNSSRQNPGTRTSQKRLYGKKRVNAPRAVLDDTSLFKCKDTSAKARAKTRRSETLDEVVAQVEGSLAAVKLDESKIPKDEEGKQQTPAVPPSEQRRQKSIKVANDALRQRTSPLKTPAQVIPAINDTSASRDATGNRIPKERSSIRIDPKKRTTKRNRPASRLSSGCVQDEKTHIYARQILDEAMSPVAAQGVQKFSSWAARSGSAFDAVKIAEGSYGEVYKLRLCEDVCKRDMSKSRLAKLRAYGEGVLKIIPLRAQHGLGSKKFTRIDEIAAEVKLLKLLDPIPGFVRFREVHVVQGRFPQSFQKAWEAYKQTQNDCLNPDPANKRAYTDNQLWAILEMDDAGVELEKFAWSSIFQVYDIFWGVAMALARAEEFALFEHRDLHLGNICLKSTRVDGKMDPPARIEIGALDRSSGFGISALETTIIDYSLSRAELRLSDDPQVRVEIASTNLDSKRIFDAIGRDEDEILLRNTYRYMRSQVYTGNAIEPEKPPSVPGIWAEYAPRTNLIWLLFILKNLLKHMEAPAARNAPQNPSRPPLQPCPSKGNMQQAASLSQSDTATKIAKQDVVEPVQHSDEDTKAKVASFQQELLDRLNKVVELLDLEHGREDMCCAADLVAYAIDEHWLNEKDFFFS